jgi:perosamine synthetase
MLPYGHQLVDDDDVTAVSEALRSYWLTTGPMVDQFERAVATFTGAAHAVAVSSGTAALHAAMHTLGLGRGDEVIVPPITFVASANAAVYVGATPVFADVDAATLLINPDSVKENITSRTRAIVAVDYAGQPCDYDTLGALARKHKLTLISDACHSLGATYHSRKVGTLADLTVFSFHPVKHITTGEGGMVVTSNAQAAARMRAFRNHGIATDHRERAEQNSWHYEMTDLGFNYRISDVQCALGLSQLRKLPVWLERRSAIASQYNMAFRTASSIEPLAIQPGTCHAWHLYVVRVKTGREEVFLRLRGRGIGVNVHYIPVHLHSFYRGRFGTRHGLCPIAEEAYERILSLPIFPAMTDDDVARVITVIKESVE